MTRGLRWITIGLGFMLLPSLGHGGAITPDHQCMGPWVGRGQNTGYSTYWTIDLNLTASPDGGRCGTIRYSNPDCHGFLDDCRLVGQDIHTRENYVHQGRCAPPGRVIIRCENNQMRYSWIGWERVDTMLRRPGGSSPPPAFPSGATGPRPSSVQRAPLSTPDPSPFPSVPGGGDGQPLPQPPTATPPSDVPSSGWSCLPSCTVAGQRPFVPGALLLSSVALCILMLLRRAHRGGHDGTL